MPTSKRLVDILDENTSEDEDYANKVLPKLEKLYQLIIDSLPMKEEDASFVLDLMEDLKDNPHHRASKMELKYCNKLWRIYAR